MVVPALIERHAWLFARYHCELTRACMLEQAIHVQGLCACQTVTT